ncbi:MAG: DUF2271 domain-containing protein [Phenylobacterium sp.]|uniref:DUF2271 domain-containing protein n=1 Tax=Phenylobacterium sp. TaxID=1871053 RepID=UPI003919C4DC
MAPILPAFLGVGLALAPPPTILELDVARWSGEHLLGASVDLAVSGGGGATLAAAAHAAIAEIRRLDAILSAWRPDSELALLNEARTMSVSPDLFAAVAMAERWRTATAGAFSARLGRLTSGALAGRPAGEEAEALRQAAEAARVDLNPALRRITRPDAVRFDLDAVAKGFILDRALAAARRGAPEADGLLIDIGGDVRVWSAERRPAPWVLAVADPDAPFDNAAPLQTLRLRSGALAVSGRSARDRRDGSAAVSHVLDPRTGQPAPGRMAAVAAPQAAQADALATALLAASPDEGRSWVDSAPGVGALVAAHGGSAFEAGAWNGRPAAACQGPAAWPKGFALTASLEIPRQTAGDYERPYVAAWITDEARNHVRTLLILGPQARWRESNYIFWRRVERMDLAAVERVARPTRAPGRYDVVWDGRTESGLSAPRGKYVLNIEASREHGGHSFISIPLNLGARPFETRAEAAQELGATLVRYGAAR